MKRLLPILLLTLLMLGSSGVPEASGQRFIIALNFEVTVEADGRAVIELKEHPFSLEGESLLHDEEVISRMMSEDSVEADILSALYMFSSDPSNVNYTLSEEPYIDYGLAVLCDVYGTGEMEELTGAIVIKVEVYLNETDALEHLEGDTFLLKARDPFTAQHPAAWVDVLEFKFGEGVELLNASWKPRDAQGPTEVGVDYLLWINPSEEAAPDVYLLTLKLPDVEISVKRVSLNLDVSSSSEGGLTSIHLKNREGRDLDLVVRLVGPGVDRARAVSLDPGEEKTVVFLVSGANLTVQVYTSGGALAYEGPVGGAAAGAPTEGEEVRPPPKESAGPPEPIKSLASLGVLVGVALMAVSFVVEGEERPEEVEREEYWIVGE
ncbi:MAG: hypothetical protein DRO06_00795 [Thermoproteota archaeon]|nr:MAG: hypothetical protein DRO06_00795 [Candidatus Korarchaeota archaeon]